MANMRQPCCANCQIHLKSCPRMVLEFNWQDEQHTMDICGDVKRAASTSSRKSARGGAVMIGSGIRGSILRRRTVSRRNRG